jgi:hypothetical protein
LEHQRGRPRAATLSKILLLDQEISRFRVIKVPITLKSTP